MNVREHVLSHFAKTFGEPPPYLVRAPGRVNLIGEHTDHNDGFVMPMAIDREVWCAFRSRPDREVWLHSLDFNEQSSFSLDDFSKGGPGWLEYVKGVAWAMAQEGHTLKGFEGVMAGNVPIGAGLSSSAALEVAMARVFAQVSDLEVSAPRSAVLGQFAENKWVGVNCGIMDQMISAVGKAGHAVFLDCRSLETRAVPIPKGCAVVVLDTMTRRGLVDSAYNERREQCEIGSRFFGVEKLRDVSWEQFQAREGELDEIVRRRCRHVISENQRTLDAADALERGDAETFGQLMNRCHESLRDDFEVSSPALDRMAECAQQHPHCIGARMTGGGFGGCAVALIREDKAGEFIAFVSGCYEKATGKSPTVYLCKAVDGASIIASP